MIILRTGMKISKGDGDGEEDGKRIPKEEKKQVRENLSDSPILESSHNFSRDAQTSFTRELGLEDRSTIVTPIPLETVTRTIWSSKI